MTRHEFSHRGCDVAFRGDLFDDQEVVDFFQVVFFIGRDVGEVVYDFAVFLADPFFVGLFGGKEFACFEGPTCIDVMESFF